MFPDIENNLTDLVVSRALTPSYLLLFLFYGSKISKPKKRREGMR